MKKTRFVFIGCLLAAAAISLFALVKVSPQLESQDSAMQTSSPHRPTNNGNITGGPGRHSNGTSETKKGVRVSNNPDRHSNNTHKTNNGGTDKSVSKPVASTSKINRAPSGNLSSDAGGNLRAGQNSRSTSADETTDKAKSDNADNADGLYAGNPEACGQDGKPLPSPEAVLARKAQDILKYYKDRKAKDVVIESEIETGEDGSETELRTNSPQENTSPDSADTQQVPAEAAGDTEISVESLAQQSLHDESVDHELQVEQIMAALAENNPTEVRLQAIYLLGDVAPDRVESFLDDKDDLIRCEAERIVGILPQDYN